MKAKTPTAERRYPALRQQLFALLALFILLMLALLWFFQIALLKPMYESIRRHELSYFAAALARADSDSLQEEADRFARRTNICCTVYEISGQYAMQRASAHILSGCVIHNVSSESMMNRLYAGARANALYTERVTDPALESAGESVPETLIAARLVDTADGRTLLIVLDAEIEPVGTTINTLKIQLAVITALLLIAAAVLAAVLSSRISRPITQMSREAKKLALGTYDVHFEGGRNREIAELSDALNHAATELSALDSMQKELIANISHDLRTPLTMISGYSEVMRDIPGEMTPENMQIIIAETQRLNTLVNDILDLSRLTSGTQTLSCETISLTETVRSTLDRYAKLRTHDGYKITFENDREAYIYADKSKILQVLYNLVNNAINYTGEDKSVAIRQITKDGACRIEVTDTGEGIPADQLPLIWDRYYRVKNYHKRGVAGSGLGLSIVKNILVLHGAQFGVTSEPGRGSTFWFSLPEVPKPEAGDTGNTGDTRDTARGPF